ncbi:S-adenosyl-L-methionine-dependent methyltransferase [Microdochium trichocladiopsis]|uniref:S-adenosyl-L-methionine-dependent methyltransferase n=1 Tax=Microdochium trichocladiopsis TaxID=1682393 RepID=A0A9P8XTY9_9PEZI|nr:S-adenosyl-L-methionine-dependent methyltransferase [Microdochium trichocladiopsis]KAH7018305.1 S-adenosyl-L-methionine-dependent methyltransferase [Microdochium trichocladiopsis]
MEHDVSSRAGSRLSRHTDPNAKPAPAAPGVGPDADASPPGRAAVASGSPLRSAQDPADQMQADSTDDDNDDDDGSDVDSALGEDDFRDDDSMSTVSLSESILQYRLINGRRYHSASHGSSYWGPNDERSSDAEDISHQVFLCLLENKLFLAPLQKEKIRKVLDIGTGTGMWANDFADDFPGAEVIGTDISPIQPAWTAPNCRFEMEDAELQWTFARSSFDFIHMRTMGGAIQDWPKLYRQAYDALRPGGWIESYETEAMFSSDDCEIAEDSPLRMWPRYFGEAGKLMGRTFQVVSENVQVTGIEAAGFKNIEVVQMKSPIGPWSSEPRLKKSGLYAYLALDQDLEGYISYVWTRVLKKPIEEMHVYLARFRKAIRAPNARIYLPQKIVYAQKPLDAE